MALKGWGDGGWGNSSSTFALSHVWTKHPLEDLASWSDGAGCLVPMRVVLLVSWSTGVLSGLPWSGQRGTLCLPASRRRHPGWRGPLARTRATLQTANSRRRGVHKRLYFSTHTTLPLTISDTVTDNRALSHQGFKTKRLKERGERYDLVCIKGWDGQFT